MFLHLFSTLVHAIDTAPVILELLGFAAITCIPGGVGFLLMAFSSGTDQERSLNITTAFCLMALGALESLAFSLSEVIGLYATVTWWDSLVRCFTVAEALGLTLTFARALPLGPAAALRILTSTTLLAFAAFALVYTAVTAVVSIGVGVLICLFVFVLIMFF